MYVQCIHLLYFAPTYSASQKREKKSLLKRQAGKIKTKTSLLFFLSLGPADTADIADITVHAILQY